MEALETVHTDSDLLDFLNTELGIAPDEVDSVLRNMISHYAAEGYATKPWRDSAE